MAISPGLSGGGVDDSVALPSAQAGPGSVADAAVARHATPKPAAENVVDVGPGRAGRAGREEPGADAALAVARAQPVASVGGAPEATPPANPSPAPAAQPVSSPAPETPSAPVTTPLPGESGSRPPVAAGGGGIGEEPGCEGDEYVLVITPEGEESLGVPPLFAIRIEYFGSDGSEGEFSLQGDETEVRELLALLGADGGCVRVEEKPLGEVVEPVAGEPEAGTEAAGLGETLESELP